MTMPDVSGLPENLDATYADDTDNPTRKAHQQHHDTVHAAVKALLPRAEASSTYASRVDPAGVDFAGPLTVNGVAVGGAGGGSTVTVDADGTLVVDGVTVEVATDTQLADGLAANATADRARANHTGTQAISTVTGLQTALDAKLASADAPELIRDTVGTALVAGSNVTITPSDAGDTITIAAASGGAGGGATVKVKTADESVASSVALQPDDALFFPVAANERWVGAFNLLVTGSSGDLTFSITAPAGATVVAAMMGSGRGSDSIVQPQESVTDTVATVLLATVSIGVRYVFSVSNGATAGNVALTWAQKTSNATASTVYAGSHVIAHKIA